METEEQTASPEMVKKQRLIGSAFLLAGVLAFIVIFLNLDTGLFDHILPLLFLLVIMLSGILIGLGFLFVSVVPDTVTEVWDESLDYPLY